MSHIDEGLLHAWIDGALHDDAEHTHAAVARHLAGCADCRMRLEEARQLRDMAAEILATTIPPGIDEVPPFERLVGGAAKPPLEMSPTPPSGRRLPITVIWAASLVLALGAGWWAHHLTLSANADSAGEVYGPGTHQEASRSGYRESADAGVAGETAAPDAVHTRRVAPHDDGLAGNQRLATTDAQGGVTTRDAGTVVPTEATRPGSSVIPGDRRDLARSAREMELEREVIDQAPGMSITRRSILALRPMELPEVDDDWVRVDRAAAEAWTDAPLAVAPELPILDIAIAEFEGARAARVRQELPDGGLFEMVQRVESASTASGRQAKSGLGWRIVGFVGRLPRQLVGGDSPWRDDGRSGQGGKGHLPPSGRSAAAPGGIPAGPPVGGAAGRPEALAGADRSYPGAMVPDPTTPRPSAGGIPRRAHRVVPDPLAGAGSVVLHRDGLIITARALVPPDSLRVLLQRVR